MLETMPKNLALKVAIVQSGRSQIQVAKDASLPESRLSRIINGHDVASAAERRALARILKRKADELFPDEALAS